MNKIKIPVLIARISRFQRKYLNENLKEFNIDSTQGIILTKIKEKSCMTSKELTDLGIVEKPAVSKNIKKLESLDYIYKESSKSDARSFSIYLTEKGQEVTSYIDGLIEKIDFKFKEIIGEKALRDVRDLLEKLERDM